MFLGDPSVSKTNLLHRFVSNKFSNEYKPTFGTNNGIKKIKVNDIDINFKIWDYDGLNFN